MLESFFAVSAIIEASELVDAVEKGTRGLGAVGCGAAGVTEGTTEVAGGGFGADVDLEGVMFKGESK